MSKSLTYRVPEETGLAGLAEWLQGALEMREERSGILCLRYLDTADWRLYSHGAALEEQSGPQGTSLRLYTLYNHKTIAVQSITRSPRFCFELSVGMIRKRLDLWVDTAALEVKARMVCKLQGFVQRNADAKIVLRAQIEQNTALDASNKAHPLGRRLRLMPVKGYRGARKRAARRIHETFGWQDLREDPLMAALGAVAPMHEGASAELRQSLAATAVKTRLLHWLDTMVENEDGVRTDQDLEPLHRLRVAVRRTRAAVAQLRRSFPRGRLKGFARKFRDFARVSSLARDLDVQVLDLKAQLHSLAPTQRRLLTPMLQVLRADRLQARELLLAKLSSRSYRRLLQDWREFLCQGELDAALAPGAPRQLEGIAAHGIAKFHARAQHQSLEFDADTPAVDLHELRKTLKKLRYSVELFKDLYPSEQIGPLLQTLRRVQDSLGKVQDLRVQAELLAGLQPRIALHLSATPGAEAALDALLAGLGARERAARLQLTERFEEFACAENAQRFAALSLATNGLDSAS